MCTFHFIDHNEIFWQDIKENNQLNNLNFINKAMFHPFKLNQTSDKILLIDYHVRLNTRILLKKHVIYYLLCICKWSLQA